MLDPEYEFVCAPQDAAKVAKAVAPSRGVHGLDFTGSHCAHLVHGIHVHRDGPRNRLHEDEPASLHVAARGTPNFQRRSNTGAIRPRMSQQFNDAVWRPGDRRNRRHRQDFVDAVDVDGVARLGYTEDNDLMRVPKALN